MNKKIDDITPKLGQFIRVNNMERATATTPQEKWKRARECSQYVSLQVEDVTSEGERCLLFTMTEFLFMNFVEFDTSMVKFVFGRLYPANIGKRDCYLIKTKHWDGTTHILRISQNELAKADARAIDHPKSITTKPAIVDMFD